MRIVKNFAWINFCAKGHENLFRIVLFMYSLDNREELKVEVTIT